MKIKVKLHGGPKDGQWIDYYQPLPKTIVITEVSGDSLKYHDYERTSVKDYNYTGENRNVV